MIAEARRKRNERIERRLARAMIEAKREKEMKLKMEGREFERKECLRLGSKWYDKAYANERNVGYEPYFPLWDRVFDWIGVDEVIVDLGCGIGLFAQKAIAAGKLYGFGVDYSQEAISQAKEYNPEHAHTFVCSDLFSVNIPVFPVCAFVLLEVLEHLKDDCGLFFRFPSGQHIIFSVPSFDCASHVRYFRSRKHCVERYSPFVKIRRSAKVVMNPDKGSCIWVFTGKVK